MSRLILADNLSSATLCVLDTCVIVGPGFDVHFDHRFIVFKDVQLRFSLRRICVWETQSTVDN